MKSRYLSGLLVVVSSLLMVAPGYAQVSGRNFKVFVGYANLQAEGVQNTNTPAGVFDTDFFRDRTTLHGGDVSVTGAYKGIGLTGDFSFNRSSKESDFTNGHGNVHTDIM